MAVHQRQQAEPVTMGAALISELRSQPSTRSWLSSRSEPILRALAIALGLPDDAVTTAQLIDQILAFEWERTRR